MASIEISQTGSLNIPDTLQYVCYDNAHRTEIRQGIPISIDEILNKIEKKENKEMELLEIYFEEKQRQLEIKRDAKYDKIKLKDPVIRDLEALVEKYKDVKGISVCIKHEYQFSKEIYAELDKCEKDYKRQKGELIGLKKEIIAQLDLCETYEQKQAILKAYGVIDEQGKLNK